MTASYPSTDGSRGGSCSFCCPPHVVSACPLSPPSRPARARPSRGPVPPRSSPGAPGARAAPLSSQAGGVDHRRGRQARPGPHGSRRTGAAVCGAGPGEVAASSSLCSPCSVRSSRGRRVRAGPLPRPFLPDTRPPPPPCGHHPDPSPGHRCAGAVGRDVIRATAAHAAVVGQAWRWHGHFRPAARSG